MGVGLDSSSLRRSVAIVTICSEVGDLQVYEVQDDSPDQPQDENPSHDVYNFLQR